MVYATVTTQKVQTTVWKSRLTPVCWDDQKDPWRKTNCHTHVIVVRCMWTWRSTTTSWLRKDSTLITAAVLISCPLEMIPLFKPYHKPFWIRTTQWIISHQRFWQIQVVARRKNFMTCMFFIWIKDSLPPSGPYQKLKLLVVHVRMIECSYYSSTDLVNPERTRLHRLRIIQEEEM